MALSEKTLTVRRLGAGLPLMGKPIAPMKPRAGHLTVEVLNASVHPVGDPFGAVDSWFTSTPWPFMQRYPTKQPGIVTFIKHSPALAVVKNRVGQVGQAQVTINGKSKQLLAGSFTTLFDHN